MCIKKHVYVAYTNYAIEISNTTGEMVKWPVMPFVYYYNMAHEWEIQEVFFATNNIQPTWLSVNSTFGTLNYTTGQWSGAVGMIQRDEADYAICCFFGTYNRSKVAAFSASGHFPKHWLSRNPLELSPTWNLLGLFTKGYISQRSFLTSPTTRSWELLSS